MLKTLQCVIFYYTSTAAQCVVGRQIGTRVHKCMHLRPSDVHLSGKMLHASGLALAICLVSPICTFFQCTLNLHTSPAMPSLVDSFMSRSDIRLPRVHEGRRSMFHMHLHVYMCICPFWLDFKASHVLALLLHGRRD